MHSVLYILVDAGSKSGALDEVDDFYYRWLSDKGPYGGPYDYYKLMDQSSRVSGASRWTEFQGEPLAVQAGTPKGLSWLEDGWESTIDEYERTLQRIQDELEGKSPEQVLEDNLLRHSFRTAASPSRTDIHLYDGTEKSRFEPMVIEPDRWETIREKQYRSGSWVVPIDVHF